MTTLAPATEMAVSTGGRRRFFVQLGMIALGALALRVAYVALVTSNDHTFYDSAYYQLQGLALALGRGFVNPFLFGTGPAADHPPLTAILVAPVPYLFGYSRMGLMRYEIAILGVLVVVFVGVLGDRIAGPRVGLIAAALTAVYPNVWVNDGLVMSETPAMLLTVLAILLAYGTLRRPTWWRAALLGLCAGLAALTRAELVLLVPFFGLGVPLMLRDASASTRVRLAAIGLLAPLLVVGPWVGYNLTRFEKPVIFSTNDGLTLDWANCPETYSGPELGLLSPACQPVRPAHGDESVWSEYARKRGLHFVKAHLFSVPKVVAARIGRGWSVYRPLDMLSVGTTEGRPRWVTGLGLAFYYPLVLLAIGGIVVLVRRRATVWPLLVPPVIVTITLALTWGQTRFRAPAEVSLVVLAAVAIDGLVRSRRPIRDTVESESVPTP